MPSESLRMDARNYSGSAKAALSSQYYGEPRHRLVRVMAISAHLISPQVLNFLTAPKGNAHPADDAGKTPEYGHLLSRALAEKLQPGAR